MEKTPNTEPQEQGQKVVTPDKEETVQAPGWPKRMEKVPTWKEVAAKAQNRTWSDPPRERDGRLGRAH